MMDDAFHTVIAVRTHTRTCRHRKRSTIRANDIGYSNRTVILDTETTTDQFHKLRFGPFQVRKLGEIERAGIFFDPEVLSMPEQQLLKGFCEANDLELLTLTEFRDQIFF